MYQSNNTKPSFDIYKHLHISRNSTVSLFSINQNLYLNCSGSTGTSDKKVETFVSQINNYPCDSRTWYSGLNYQIPDCNFSLESFQTIVNAISTHLVQCKDHIIQYLTARPYYRVHVNLNNKENNTSIGIKGIKHLAKTLHNLSQEFSRVSPNTTAIKIDLINNGALIHDVQKLVQSCPNFIVNYIAQNITILGSNLGNSVSFTHTDNAFSLAVDNKDVNNASCIFNQRDNYIPESSALIDIAHKNDSMSPWLLFSAIISALISIVLLFKYACSYSTSKDTQVHTYDTLPQDSLQVELDGEHTSLQLNELA